jgi:outer membrane scaffolding protein for murein synthesis (MipA/OmpV family)
VLTFRSTPSDLGGGAFVLKSRKAKSMDMRRAALMGAALAATASAARADAPSTPATIAPQWTVEVGGAVRERPSHLGSKVYTADLLPVIDVSYGENFHASLDDGVKYTLGRWGRLSVGPVAEYRTAYNQRLPARTPKTADSWEIGGFGVVDLTYGQLEGRVRRAVSGYDGWSADLSLGTLIPMDRLYVGGSKELQIGAELRTGWADRHFTRATFMHGAPFPTTTDDVRDYWTAGGQFGAIYHCKSGLGVAAGFADDVILSPNRLASNLKTRNVGTALVAFTYRFHSR